MDNQKKSCVVCGIKHGGELNTCKKCTQIYADGKYPNERFCVDCGTRFAGSGLQCQKCLDKINKTNSADALTIKLNKMLLKIFGYLLFFAVFFITFIFDCVDFSRVIDAAQLLDSDTSNLKSRFIFNLFFKTGIFAYITYLLFRKPAIEIK